MKTVFRFWLSMCILGTVLTLYSAMPVLVKQQQLYATSAQILMRCAQKNGGFSEQMLSAYAHALANEGLSINEIDFKTHPNVGQHAQKRELLSIEWTPIYKVNIFGGESSWIEGDRARIEGFSHRYEKE